MRYAALLLFVLPFMCATAQNITTKKMPGMSHYEHGFAKVHKLGELDDEKYPHVHLYCRSNDSSMMVFRIKIERKGATAISDEKSIPILECDGDRFQSNSMRYEQFPLSDGVLETLEFYAPTLWMEALGNSDEVSIDINGAVFVYPAELRKDYIELHKIVNTRNKDRLLEKPKTLTPAGMD